MIVTDDETLAQKCISLKNHCFRYEKRFVHKELGWNFRMRNLQAAVGLAHAGMARRSYRTGPGPVSKRCPQERAGE